MHSSSGRVSRGVQKTTGETAGFWRDTGFDRLQQRAGTKHYEQTKRQADQPVDNLAGSLPFSAPCSISNERSVFAMCILCFVFCLLLLQHGFIDEKSTCFSCFALQFCIYIVLSKKRKSAENLRFLHFESTNIWLALGELRCTTCSLQTVLTWPWSEKSSIHVVFRTFPSQ